jgi:hypothetical protein
MVIRVCALFFCVLTIFSSTSVPTVNAGGPPETCPPQISSPCAPPACGPQQCGPVAPFGPLGGILGICTSICGTVIGCPSAVAQALLAPAPRLFPRQGCAPVSCRPPACMPPACGPMYGPPPCAPAPISKCKPAPMVAPAPCGPTGCYPRTSMGPQPVGGPGNSDPITNMFVDFPIKVATGALRIPQTATSPLANALMPSKSTLRYIW